MVRLESTIGIRFRCWSNRPYQQSWRLILAKETTFAAYTIKAGARGKQNEALGSVGGVDILHLLRDFINHRLASIQDDEKASELQQFDNIHEDGRTTMGYVLTGNYGTKGLILRRGKGKVFDKTIDDADMFRFFFRVYLPDRLQVGILIAETKGVAGIMSIFQRDFLEYVRDKQPEIAIRIARVAPGNYVDAILGDGMVKSIRFVKYQAPPDLASKLENFGIAENFGSIEVEIRPKRTGSFRLYDTLMKRMTGSKGDDGLVEIVGQNWNPDKTLVTVEINGRHRTLQVETLGVGRPDVVADLVPSPDDGLPSWEDLTSYTLGLTNDLITSLQVS